MLKYIPIQSGSHGNCAVLFDEYNLIIMDAGVHPKIVDQVLIKNGYPRSRFNTTTLLCTHLHTDHAKYLLDWVKLIGDKNIIRPGKYEDALHQYQNLIDDTNYGHVSNQKRGTFTFTSYDMKHDVDCFGFIIEHPIEGKIVYFTDSATPIMDPKARNADYYIVECNNGLFIPKPKEIEENELELAKLIYAQGRHMSIETLVPWLRASIGPKTQHIHFLHVSTRLDNVEVVKSAALAIGHLDKIKYTFIPSEEFPNTTAVPFINRIDDTDRLLEGARNGLL